MSGRRSGRWFCKKPISWTCRNQRRSSCLHRWAGQCHVVPQSSTVRWNWSCPFVIDQGFPADVRHLRLWKTATLLRTRSYADVQIQDGRSAQQQALRAAVLSMFADNQAAVQHKPLLSSIGISVPPPHNILRHVRSQLRHQAVRLGLTAAVGSAKHLLAARLGSCLRCMDECDLRPANRHLQTARS